MVEAGKTAAGKNLAKLGERGFAHGIFAPSVSGAAIRDGNGIDIRNVEARSGKYRCNRQLRERMLLVSSREFFFFDRGKDGVTADQASGGIGTGARDAKNF